MKRKILGFLIMITMLLSIFTNVKALTTGAEPSQSDVFNISSMHTKATSGYHYSIRAFDNSLLKSSASGYASGNGVGIVRYKDSTGATIFCADLGATYGAGVDSTNSQPYIGNGPACGIVKSMNGTDVSYTVGEVLSGENTEATGKKWTITNKITAEDFDRYTTDNESYVRIQRAIWKYQNYTGSCDSSYEVKTGDNPINFSLERLSEKVVTLSSDDRYYETTLSYPQIADVVDLFTEDIRFIVSSPVEVEYVSKTQAKIKVPIGSFVNGMRINLRATGKYTANNYTTYMPKVTVYTMPGAQNMATVSLDKTVGKTITIDTSTDVTLTLPTGSIELVKSDSNNGTKIQGAKFKLYVKKGTEYVNATNYKGNLIPELVTDANGKISVVDLPYGTYKLEETAAAEGYVYDEKNHYSQTFTLNASNQKFVDEVTNESIKLIISKQDIANEKEIEGAKIVIYKYDTAKKEKGEVVKEFVSSKTAIQFYIEPGVYALEETVAPESYKKVETTFVFEVTKDRSVKLLETYSEKNIKASKNKITLYNEVEPVIIPDVPDTGNSTTTLLVVLGSILLMVGSAIIYFTLKRKSAQSI